MAKKTNPTAVGVFVLGALALVVAGVLIFGSGKFFAETHKLVLYFDGSVKGLDVGAPVVFRGVKVGSVTEVQLYHDLRDLSFQIPVVIELEAERFHVVGEDTAASGEERFQELIKRGLRGQLQSQSMLTGKLMVEIDFHPDKPVKLVGGPSKYPELPTVLTAFQQISKTLQEIPLEEIAHRVAGSLAGIERMVNSPEAREATQALQETLKETATLVRGLNEKLDPLASSIEETLQDTRKLLRNTDQRVGSLASGLGKAVGDSRKLIQNADGRVTRVASSVDETVRDAQKVVRNVDDWVAPAVDNFVATSKDARAVLARAESTLATVEGMTSESSSLRFEFTNALRELSAAARSLRILAEYLEQHPDALLRGKSGQGGN